MMRPQSPTAASLLGPSSLIRLASGTALAVVCVLAVDVQWRLSAAPAVILGLGMALATLIRGFELRAWFGRGLSLHQSQSMQSVLDFARWASPLLDRRRLEVEFVARETSRPSHAVAEWSRSRQSWRVVLLSALPALVATIIAPNTLLATAGWFTVAVATVMSSPHWHQPARKARRTVLLSHVAMIACAVLALAIEAASIALVARLLVDDPAIARAGAAVVFVALGLARAVPVAPFGVGLFEALVLAGLWLVGAAEVAALAVLAHLLWIALGLAPGMIYLSRYKLTLADLFDRRLPSLLARSRRPTEGWAPDARASGTVEITVAIPAYNERERLPLYLPDVIAHLAAQSYTWEVVVADDGSRDGTGDYVKSIAVSEPRLRLVQRARNGGKGRAVLDAIEAARGRYVLIADADGATPIREIEALRAAIADGAELAIGSRVAPRDGRIRDRDALRALIGKVFYGLVNFLAVPGIGDTQCGFKLLRRDVAHALFRELGEFGWAFDVEILYRAQLAGFRVAEVAVEWHEIAGSKLRPARDAWRMLVSLFRIRARNAGFTGTTGQALLAGRAAPSLGDSA